MIPTRTALALLLCLAAAPAPGVDPPPAQGTRLHFRKTLFVQQTPGGKVFAETRRVRTGETLWKILSRDYRIDPDALPAFVAAFRQVNPEVDPDRLVPGQVVRVPFKVEQRIAGGRDPLPRTYRVRPGDSLWRILRRRYGVARDDMGRAVAAVVAANPRLKKNPDRLLVGQQLVIPEGLAGPGQESGGATAELPGAHRSALELLEALGCRVSRTGETFLPLGRGRTVRLDAREFPLVTGPGGRRILLDPRGRLSPALGARIQDAWGYRVVAGVDDAVEAYLARILPHLGFYELAEGVRTISLGAGAELLAEARWTVVARPRDLWEGEIHLIFPPGAALDPALVAEARRAGFAVHQLGAGLATAPPAPPADRVAELDMTDPAAGAGRLLSVFGIPHRVAPEIELPLGGGVRYRVRPQLTFQDRGTRYAVPPPAPARAATLLGRGGYFVVNWPPDVTPLNRLGDLLGLLGIPHTRTTVEVPPGGGLRLRVSGVVFDHPDLAALLYPGRAATGRLLLTEAPLRAGTAAPLVARGLLPWVVRTGAGPPAR